MHKFIRTHMQKGKHLCPIFVLSWSGLTLSRSVALNFFVGSTFSPHINGIEEEMLSNLQRNLYTNIRNIRCAYATRISHIRV